MNLKFWHKEKEESKGFAPYEDINGKRTSALGYFFLILMVIFGITQGQFFLNAVQSTVDRPQSNSYCLSTLLGLSGADINTSYRYSGFSSSGFGNCATSVRENALGLNSVYSQAGDISKKIASLESERTSLQNQINNLSNRRAENRDDYQTALIEDVAQTEGVLESRGLGTSMVGLDKNIASLQQQLRVKETELEKYNFQLQQLAKSNEAKLVSVQDQYVHEMKVYEFNKFFVSFILIAPIFYLVWRRYSVAKENRSENVIIWGGLVATFGFIFAQIILVFVYDVLPKELIQAVFEFLSAFSFLWVLLYWSGFVLVPLFFGWLIYLIQRKLYNKKAVLFRTLKNSQCPQCTMKIHPQMNNCPLCGYKLKEQCQVCGHMTLKDGDFCEVCGVSRNDGLN